MAIETSFLGQLDKFSLILNKRVTSKYIGPRKSISTGRGLIFKEHRIYSPGDDIRSIDWRVFARTDHLYVKTYEEERNLAVHILVDYSASMNFGKPLTKFDYSAMLGVGFAYLAMKENEKFQFSTFSDQLSVFQPKRGMGQLIAMVDHLNSIKTKGPSKLKDALSQYKKMIGSRSMVVVISDFLIPIDEINEALYFLGDHEIKIIQVLDPLEIELKLQGDFKLKDSETGDKTNTFISPRLRMEYQKLLSDHSAKIQETCTNLGMKFHLITTDTPIFDAFYKILG
ncbi:MAG: DUF58 domain-containing protein [Nanoarchaeota archaeon]|nr:DUF58 domain-containing protein [Nanoarchaeota archaeon]MBU1004542.1 DUF58 domain-containing protein [Nanoarchaeota archaeon]MBU1945921.1 DUF58 domain-containing protein [Nanoarchaeota archaeon]